MGRFYAERLLPWTRELERLGACVPYGITGRKTHAKTAIVVRKEAGGLRCYVHLGTGNYNVKTAHLYADVGLLTCDPLITHDVVELFHYLTGHADAPRSSALLVAPTTLRKGLIDLIQR